MLTDNEVIEQGMAGIFAGLQALLNEVGPGLRNEDPHKFAHILELVASGEASFGARIATAPGCVTLTLITELGEQDLVSFFYSGALN